MGEEADTLLKGRVRIIKYVSLSAPLLVANQDTYLANDPQYLATSGKGLDMAPRPL
jgi:hypothetical protein